MKKTLPMLPLRGKYIFPNTVIHFDVSRSRSVKAIEEAMEHDQMIFLNNQIDPTAEDPGIEDLYRVGTLARIKQVVKLPKNILRVFAEGLFRAELSETVEYEPFYKVEVLYDHVEQQSFEEFEREAFLRMIKEAFEGYAKAWPHLDQNIVNYILLLTDVEILVDELATHIPFSYPEKQKLLEEMDLKERCELMLVMLQEELDVLKLKQKIQQKVKVNIDKNQKEYVLREQIKVIREELGETNVEDEADEFMEKLKNLKASDEVKEKLKKEISRFQTMGNQTPESSVLRTSMGRDERRFHRLRSCTTGARSRSLWNGKSQGTCFGIFSSTCYEWKERCSDPLSCRTSRNRKDIYCQINCESNEQKIYSFISWRRQG